MNAIAIDIALYSAGFVIWAFIITIFWLYPKY